MKNINRCYVVLLGINSFKYEFPRMEDRQIFYSKYLWKTNSVIIFYILKEEI